MTYETDKQIEKVILAGVFENAVVDSEEALQELYELAKTSGAEVAGYMTQSREAAHPAHYLGKGKLEELKEMVNAFDATGVICDDELSSAQMRNMEKALHVKIMDRTMLILDIFARRASSAEGKVQVELAQLKYNMSHLAGIGTSLSRLGGGIGTRGPGEKKLETDRRHIRTRLSELNRELKEIQDHRAVLRGRREKTKIPVVSMVGYTNAGKSTLMNVLTNAGVLAENKLFATLDTTTRKVELPNGSEILFTDTVGFIQKLPPQLVSAFRATLEELSFADILVHVVDASNAKRDEQMQAVYKTLTELKCLNVPIISVYNKIDMQVETPLPRDNYAAHTIQISAKTGEGIDELLTAIETVLKSFRKHITVLIPYTEGKLLNAVHSGCEILREEHLDEGTYLQLYANEEIGNRLQGFICEEK